METPQINELFDPATEFGARVATRLERDEIIWLTTVGSTGTPHPNPVWFYWAAGTFLLFSQPDRPKLRNIAHNPRVALHFDGDGSGGDIVVFGGTARFETATHPEEVAAYLAKYRDGLAALSMTAEEFRADYSVPIRVVPDRLRGF